MKFSRLLIVYLALVALLALTLGIAWMPVGPWIKLGLGLSIAATKALLIVLFFMRVRDEGGLVRIFAAAGVFWLLIFFIIIFTDYITRQI